ncbi:Allantoinase [metagenome]|uniref:allantoinase n=1 Tax=metagenome TaxID=256318 RepID=A0A2P2C423_9ZZZZ
MSTDQFDLVVRGRQVVTPSGAGPRSIGVRHGVITAVDDYESDLGRHAKRVLHTQDDEVLLPGLVDSHVHINDPGRTDWEGFSSATRAAAAGGITTLVDMPLNSIPPTCDVPALELKQSVARDQAYVDLGFWGGAIPSSLGSLRSLHEAGVFGFKCFLLPSGVDEFPALDAEQLRSALGEVAAFDGLMIVHAEDHEVIDSAPEPKGARYDDFLRSRPRGAENLAIARLIEDARITGARVHVLHLSSSDAIPMIRSARREGVRLTVETCPHYLTLVAGEIPDGATQFKCCPPIREKDNREELWRAVADGDIDIIVSDHSPSTSELKQPDSGDFGLAWGGISSLQLGLPLVWTEARRRGYSLTDVARWMAEGPARHAGLSTKGRIAVGADADFCVVAPDERFTVDTSTLLHRNAVSPYHGRDLRGRVRQTWLAGHPIVGPLATGSEPRGRLLRRGNP